MWFTCTETNKKAFTWLREYSSCSCLTALPGSSWVLLSKTYMPFSSPLHKPYFHTWRLLSILGPCRGILLIWHPLNFLILCTLSPPLVTCINQLSFVCFLGTPSSADIICDCPQVESPAIAIYQGRSCHEKRGFYRNLCVENEGGMHIKIACMVYVAVNLCSAFFFYSQWKANIVASANLASFTLEKLANAHAKCQQWDRFARPFLLDFV